MYCFKQKTFLFEVKSLKRSKYSQVPRGWLHKSASWQCPWRMTWESCLKESQLSHMPCPDGSCGKDQTDLQGTTDKVNELEGAFPASKAWLVLVHTSRMVQMHSGKPRLRLTSICHTCTCPLILELRVTWAASARKAKQERQVFKAWSLNQVVQLFLLTSLLILLFLLLTVVTTV